MSRQQRITAVFAAVFGDTMPTKLVPRLPRLTELAGAFVDACEMGEPKALSPSAVRTGIDWDSEKRLGNIPDGTLARLLGVSVATVRSARVVRGLPLYRPAQELPEAAATSTPQVKPKRGGLQKPVLIDWDAEARLGTMSDKKLSRLLKCDPKTVQKARCKRGIKAFGVSKVDWDQESRLGRMSDAALARELGITRAAVHFARKKRGISLCSATEPTNGEVPA
jgi:hypothetical protein